MDCVKVPCEFTGVQCQCTSTLPRYHSTSKTLPVVRSSKGCEQSGVWIWEREYAPHFRWYVRLHAGNIHPTAAPFLPQCAHFSLLPRLIPSSTCFNPSLFAQKYTSGHHIIQFWCA